MAMHKLTSRVRTESGGSDVSHGTNSPATSSSIGRLCITSPILYLFKMDITGHGCLPVSDLPFQVLYENGSHEPLSQTVLKNQSFGHYT